MGTKIYTLYPSGGRISNQSADYDGHELKVAASSVKQAFALAYKNVWAPGPEQPVGIVQEYRRNGYGDDRGWWHLWCGCYTHSWSANEFKHLSGQTAIVRVMESHTCP